MIRDTLLTVTKMYEEAATESFTEHPLADYLRHEAPEEISKTIRAGNLICKGSPL